MAKQTINIGASPNDGTGTPLRTAFDYTNQNFTELYTATGPSGNNIVVPGNATITGDLTVDTSTLKVDSANNYVGIGTASPAQKLHADNQANSCFIRSTSTQNSAGFDFGVGGTGDATAYINNRNNTPIVFAINNTEQMRLNATGLGVGASPSYKIHALSTVPDVARFERSGAGGAARIQLVNGSGTVWYFRNGVNDLAFNYEGTDLVTFGSSGNVGIGVTPSAWASIYRTLELPNGSSIWGQTDTPQLSLQTNAFLNSSFQWIYKTTAAASNYRQTAGTHFWFTATSGTLNTEITQFATAKMTLDASGNLLLATTTNTPSARQYINQASGSNPALYIAGGASTTPLINFNGAGRMRSDGQYLVMETTNASGVIYVTANTNGVYLAVGGTSWTANSDERLKDIIEPINNAVEKVASLRSVIGKFKNDQTNTRRSFLIAQDVQAVLPEAVDASNPDRLGVAYSEVIPLLVAAIKELTARVQTLEAK